MAEKLGILKKPWRYFVSLYYRTLHDPQKIERYKRFLKKLPIQKNKVVMDNYEGLGFGENPKYIAEELLKKSRPCKIIWLTLDTRSSYPKRVKPVRRDSFRAYYECATAKAWVFNTRHGKLVEKREGQVFLQTWHGGVALKKVEKDAEPILTERYILSAKHDGEVADGIIVDGTLNEGIFETSFWLSPNCERLKIGQPRVDALLKEQDNQTIKNKVRNNLGIKKDSFFVLYAPTFRRHDSLVGYITDFTKIRKAFEERFGQIEIAVRLHPNAAHLMKNYQEKNGDALIDATPYPDVQELVVAADCVITDYSSIAYDFAMMRKPVFIVMKDVEAYIADRGVYDVFYDQPFVMNYNEDMLVDEIRDFSYEEAKKRIDDFYTRYPTYNDGHAAEKAADWLISKGLKAL